MNDVVSQAFDLIARNFRQFSQNTGDPRVAAAFNLYSAICERLRSRPEHTALAEQYARDPIGRADDAKAALLGDPSASSWLGPMLSAALRAGRDVTIGDRFTNTVGDVKVSGRRNKLTFSMGNKTTKKIAVGGFVLLLAVGYLLFVLLGPSSQPSAGPAPGPDSAQPTATPVDFPSSAAPSITGQSLSPLMASPSPTSTVPRPPAAAFSAGYGGVTGSSRCSTYLQ